MYTLNYWNTDSSIVDGVYQLPFSLLLELREWVDRKFEIFVQGNLVAGLNEMGSV